MDGNNNNNHSPLSISSSTSGLARSGIASSSEIKKIKTSKSRYRVMVLVALVLVVTQLLGIFMFSKGFFPRKTSLEGYNSFAAYQPSCVDTNVHHAVDVKPQFGKMVFMVVDAFRSSFLFGEDNIGMKYTKSLIDAGRTHSFVARASAPTVTLPRIKALVSGGIPSFVDFVLNFNSNSLKEDNLLYQLRAANKKMLFFGDDTWLKLFPDHFDRYDGTTSFYVADTVEVDYNVTRHLPEEMERHDWDVMFLHYLGLDHIGHLEGPYSHLMGPKQHEVDGIIKMIHEKLLQRDQEAMDKYLNDSIADPSLEKPLPTLFIFCSDHGMNEIGNHGGSSDSETSAILVMMSSLYYHQNDPVVEHVHKKEEEAHGRGEPHFDDADVLPKYPPRPPGEVQQVDLVPSLSLLFNLPIPKNSLGRMIPQLFDKFISEEQYLRALEINCQQQIDILKNNVIFWKNDMPAKPKVAALIKTFEEAQQFHSSWSLSPAHSHFHENAASLYIQFLREVQGEFSALLTSFDENLLIIGILLIGSSAIVTLLITTSAIGMSTHQGNLEIKGITFVLMFIGFVGLLLGIHFGVICFSSDAMSDNSFCTEEFRFGVFSFVFTALSLLIGFNVFLSRNNLKLLAYPSLSPLQLRKEKYILIVGTILHLVSLFGSSLVEEEHQTWYFLTTSVILLQLAPHSVSILYYVTNQSSKQNKDSLRQMFILMGILVALRIFRIWNQTGIKWLDDTEALHEYTYIDMAKFLVSGGVVSSTTLWLLSLVSVVSPCIYVFRMLDRLKDRRGGIMGQLSFIYKFVIVLCAAAIFSYKWDYIPSYLIEPAYVARFAYLCVAFLMLIAGTFPFFSKNDRTVNSPQNHTPSWFIVTLKFVPTLITVNMTMMFLLLHKPHNMFLFTIMGFIGHYYLKYLLEDTGRRARSGMTGVVVGMICIHWLGQFGYFAFGNSNSLSSIDISGAYTGLIDYNQYIVGTLTFVIAYSAPLFFFFISVSYSAHLAIKSINNNNQVEPSLVNVAGTSADIINELQWYSLIGGLLDCGIKWANIFVFSMCIMIQRYHLFIWTVFSPKYIYEVMDVALVLVKALVLTLFI
eukprot:gene13890-16385_t